jgi:tRNA(Ile)-lysidine synthase
VTRAQIERHARRRGLSWCEDASNRDPRYARGRLRQGGLAALAAEMNPRWLRAVGDLAEAQRRDAEWIDGSVEEAERGLVRAGPDGLELAATGWEALPEPLARRVVRRVLHRSGAGRDVSRTHLLRVLAFLRDARPGRRIELPGGLELARERRGYRLRRRGVQPAGEC